MYENLRFYGFADFVLYDLGLKQQGWKWRWSSPPSMCIKEAI